MRTLRSQVIHLYRLMKPARYHDATSVTTAPPMKPSHVFLGLSLISGVRPTVKPAMRGHRSGTPAATAATVIDDSFSHARRLQLSWRLMHHA